MRYKAAIAGLGALTAVISGCGGGGGSETGAGQPPLLSQTQSLDTQQVLVQAKATSETTSPYSVNNGALVLTDTSEISDPISID